jgi:hypothetical protein
MVQDTAPNHFTLLPQIFFSFALSLISLIFFQFSTMSSSSCSSQTVSPGDTEPLDDQQLDIVFRNIKDEVLQDVGALEVARRLRLEKVTQFQSYAGDVFQLASKGQPLFSEVSMALSKLKDSRLLSGEVIEELGYFISKLDFLTSFFERIVTRLSELGELSQKFLPDDDEPRSSANFNLSAVNINSNVRTLDEYIDVIYVLRLDREQRLLLTNHFLSKVLVLMEHRELYEWFLCPDHGVMFENGFPTDSQPCIRSGLIFESNVIP